MMEGWCTKWFYSHQGPRSMAVALSFLFGTLWTRIATMEELIRKNYKLIISLLTEAKEETGLRLTCHLTYVLMLFSGIIKHGIRRILGRV